MKKGKFKKHMGCPEITEYAYDNIWDHLRFQDKQPVKKMPIEAWFAIKAEEINAPKRK